MNETAYKHTPVIIKALGGNTFLKVIFANILPLAAVGCTLLSSYGDERDEEWATPFLTVRKSCIGRRGADAAFARLELAYCVARRHR